MVNELYRTVPSIERVRTASGCPNKQLKHVGGSSRWRIESKREFEPYRQIAATLVALSENLDHEVGPWGDITLHDLPFDQRTKTMSPSRSLNAPAPTAVERYTCANSIVYRSNDGEGVEWQRPTTEWNTLETSLSTDSNVFHRGPRTAVG